jgi:hypothetical protein
LGPAKNGLWLLMGAAVLFMSIGCAMSRIFCSRDIAKLPFAWPWAQAPSELCDSSSPKAAAF